MDDGRAQRRHEPALHVARAAPDHRSVGHTPVELRRVVGRHDVVVAVQVDERARVADRPRDHPLLAAVEARVEHLAADPVPIELRDDPLLRLQAGAPRRVLRWDPNELARQLDEVVAPDPDRITDAGQLQLGG